MGETKTWSIILIIFLTFLVTAAQICYKSGINNLPELSGFILLIAGMVIYLSGAVIMIIAFRGGELSILYPLLALSYIWVCIISPIVFRTDSMNPVKWAGVFIIILGISAIGIGSRLQAAGIRRTEANK